MSDETTTTGGWSTTGATGSTPQNPDAAAAPAGFCQDCGRPLTQATAKSVGGGVFCEPCLSIRAGVPNPAQGYTTVPPYAAVPPVAVPGEPRPVLAAFLGLIPGVGAMYNGQFAKGIVHIAVFAILVSLEDDVNGIFGLFVAGWIAYMAFEAYHTARARVEGLPLPNAFGLNDIGERMGFGKSWATVGSAREPGTVPTQPAAAAAAAASASPGYVPDMQAATATHDWVGYVPPTAFASATAQQDAYAAAVAANIREQAMRDSGYYGGVPYAPAYTGPGYATAPAPGVLVPEPAASRFPVGAIWLIGLGLVILLATLLPDWRLSGRWWPPVLFAGLSVWIFTRRMRSSANLICIIRWPVILMVLAIMFALHAAYFAVTFGLTCAVLLIVFGGLLLLERTLGARPAYPVAPASYSVVPPTVEAQPEASRAVWPATEPEAVKPDTDTTKGGY